MRLAMAQLAAGEDRRRNLDRALEAMSAAHAGGADLIVFPELAVERFFPQHPGLSAPYDLAEPIPGPMSERVARRARELSLVTVFNMYEVDAEGRRFDSSPVFDADGSLLGVTRMVH